MKRTLRALLLCGFAVAAFALAVALAEPWSMLVWPRWRYLGLVVALSLAAIASLAAVRRPAAPRAAALVATSLCFAVAAAVPWFVWMQPFKALWLTMYAGVAAGVHAALWWLGPTLVRPVPPRWRRRVGFVLVQCAALAVFAELGLRALAAVHPAPILQVDADVDAVLARYRKRPGELHLGLPCDARGFNDALRAAPGDRLVVCVGDSFGLGLVPRPFHYTTVAERRLDGIEIYNAAVIAAGPPEYLKLLEDELLALRPAAVVIALFVGNDIEESNRLDRGQTWLRAIFDREQLRLWTVPGRLSTLLDERAAHPEAAIGRIQGETTEQLPGTDPAGLLARFPWLDDPALEAPTMSAATFRAVERRRARFACATDGDDRYGDLWRALAAIVAACRGVPLAVLLIPDEFQVEDQLWDRIREPGWQRDLPQRRIRAWLDRRGVACLDLLPAFRAAPANAEGRRHLYHARDTHWNRRGNEVAGRELADFLRSWLPR